MKNLIKIILNILITLALFIGIISIKADSGWDFDYDSGSSWDSGWDSGSSWDYDWDSGSSWDYDGNSDYSIDAVFFFIFFIVAVVIIISSMKNYSKTSNLNTNKPYSSGLNSTNYKAMTLAEINKIIPDFNETEFVDNAYNTYLDVQEAWSTFNYEELRSLLTDELYNTYKTQLKVLKAKKQANIMDNFNLLDIKIINVNVDNGIYTITVILDVSQRDYVVNEQQLVVRGTKLLNYVTYKLVFVSSIENTNEICPSCGAPLKGNASNKCLYCDSVITSVSKKWVLAKKEVVGQRR